jgi:AraC-like DNA-binding protein
MSSAKTATFEIPPAVFSPILAVRAIDEQVIRNTQPHHHRCGQMFGTMSGLVAVVVGEHHWIVPTGRSVWIPPNCPHSLQSYGPLQSWSIYLDEEACQRLPSDPGTMQTTALLNEAACRAARWEAGEITEAQKRIALVILDEIYSLRHDAIKLPMPKDSRALRVANALATNLSDNRSIVEWARWSGSSSKTLSRHFIDETGMTLGQWRQQARILRALELLSSELPVTTIALELGYETTSAFVAMFKRWRGMSPGRLRNLIPK